jgi:hypothetical protein
MKHWCQPPWSRQLLVTLRATMRLRRLPGSVLFVVGCLSFRLRSACLGWAIPGCGFFEKSFAGISVPRSSTSPANIFTTRPSQGTSINRSPWRGREITLIVARAGTLTAMRLPRAVSRTEVNAIRIIGRESQFTGVRHSTGDEKPNRAAFRVRIRNSLTASTGTREAYPPLRRCAPGGEVTTWHFLQETTSAHTRSSPRSAKAAWEKYGEPAIQG